MNVWIAQRARPAGVLQQVVLIVTGEGVEGSDEVSLKGNNIVGSPQAEESRQVPDQIIQAGSG